jgi:hypothetical protein
LGASFRVFYYKGNEGSILPGDGLNLRTALFRPLVAQKIHC